jgi:hypothetical protein
MICIVLVTSWLGNASAQAAPDIGSEWPVPNPPSGYYSWNEYATQSGYAVTGPIVIGGVPYSTRVLNRNYEEKNTYYQNDSPFYLEISVPAGSVLNWVIGILEYHPPSYNIRNVLPGTTMIYIGTAGSTTKLGPFSRGTADPEGKYAWRIGVMALIPPRWYWATTVQYYDFLQKVPPTLVADFQISAQNPPAVNPGESTTSTVLVSANNWKGDSILLSASAPGVVVNVNPPTVTIPGPTGTASATIAIQVPKDSPGGTIPIAVTGSGGGVTHGTTIQLIVYKLTVTETQTGGGGGSENTLILGSIAVAAIVAAGVIAVLLLTRRKAPPSPVAYKPGAYGPPPSALKPAASVPAAQQIKPGGPRVIGRRTEEK